MTGSKPPSKMLRQLLDPHSAETAAASLATHASWLKGRPPPQALNAFGDPRHSHDSAVVALACAWDPEALSPALLQALTKQGDPARRRRLAWIVKLTASASMLPTLIAVASTTAEDRIIRRYVLEAISRLEFSGSVDWLSIATLVQNLTLDPDPLIREAVTALAGIGDGHALDRIAILVNMLWDIDAAVVATAATALKRFPEPEVYLPAQLRDRLLEHPVPTVRLAAQDLLLKPK